MKQQNIMGLTEQEVTERQEQGQINVVTTAPERTVKDIIRINFLTPFNLLNLILLILVFITGQPVNGMFGFVILFNTSIGTFQEIRAKVKLDKLVLLNKVPVKILRNDVVAELSSEDIVLDDVVQFDAGDQIAIDGLVLEGQAEVDESLLSGESDNVMKRVDDLVFSGSFVVSGSVFVRTTKVGDAMYANKLASEAKNFSLVKSELGAAMNLIIKVVSFLIVPVGLILLITQLFGAHTSWQDALISAIAGIVGMIPEGLVLLTSVAFMVGAIRLSQKQTLVQDLPAIESLARVDVLCLDKTGTLTEGNLRLTALVDTNPEQHERNEQALAGLAAFLPAANTTQRTLREAYPTTNLEADIIVPFSSSRKWSGITFSNGATWILGAPDVLFLTKSGNLYERVIEEQKRGIVFWDFFQQQRC